MDQEWIPALRQNLLDTRQTQNLNGQQTGFDQVSSSWVDWQNYQQIPELEVYATKCSDQLSQKLVENLGKLHLTDYFYSKYH
mgnify:CR=1 FL=1